MIAEKTFTVGSTEIEKKDGVAESPCTCDCINFCGDDSDVRDQLVEGCAHWKRRQARQAELRRIRGLAASFQEIADAKGQVVVSAADLRAMRSLMTLDY